MNTSSVVSVVRISRGDWFVAYFSLSIVSQYVFAVVAATAVLARSALTDVSKSNLKALRVLTSLRRWRPRDQGS